MERHDLAAGTVSDAVAASSRRSVSTRRDARVYSFKKTALRKRCRSILNAPLRLLLHLHLRLRLRLLAPSSLVPLTESHANYAVIKQLIFDKHLRPTTTLR